MVSFVGDSAERVWYRHRNLWPKGASELRVALWPRDSMMKIPSIHEAGVPSDIHYMTFRKEHGGHNGRPCSRIVADDGTVVQDWQPITD